MNHIIQKQTFSLSTSSLKSGHVWERKLLPLLDGIINPSIEKYFDRAGLEDTDVVIDRVEINLGPLNKLTPQQLADKVASELSRQIRIGKRSSSDRKGTDAHKAGLSDEGSVEQNSFREMSYNKKHLTCFLYFLEHGTLPWWCEPDAIDLQGTWIDHLTVVEAALITRQLGDRPHVIDRLIFQFNDDFLVRLIRHCLPEDVDSVQEDWNWLAKHYELKRDGGRLHHAYWRYWLYKAVTLVSGEEARLVQVLSYWIRLSLDVSDKLVRALLAQFSYEDRRMIPLNMESGEISQTNGQGYRYVTTWLRLVLRRAISHDDKSRLWFKENSNIIFDENTAALSFLHSGVADDKVLASVKSFEEESTTKNKHDDENNEAYYSPLAGLVLVHPFLTELFKMTQLWNGREWTSAFARQQAVLLLGWMALGESAAPEYQFTIPKLLTGMPWAEPLDNRMILAEESKASATELLQAVVHHWSALGNTSVDGLREGFILRQGRVIRKNDDWYITIEKKAQDILVSKLPWGMSLIHLPWLGKSNIHVEWI